MVGDGEIDRRPLGFAERGEFALDALDRVGPVRFTNLIPREWCSFSHKVFRSRRSRFLCVVMLRC